MDAAPDPRGYADFLQLSRGSAVRSPAVREALRRVLDLQSGRRVLDVGCGLGAFLPFFAESVGAEGAAVGLDRSTFLLAEGRRRTAGDPGGARVAGEVERLPFADATFDACLASALLIHLTDPDPALREMVRITRPGGRIAVQEVDWEAWTLRSLDPELTRRILEASWRRIRHPLLVQELPARLGALGLRQVEVERETRSRPATHPAAYPALGARARGLALAAVEHGAVPASQAAAWLAGLALQLQAGQYLEEMTLVTAWGVR